MIRSIFVFLFLFTSLLAAPVWATPHQLAVDAQPAWQEKGYMLKAGKRYLVEANGKWTYGDICGKADANGKGNNIFCAGIPIVAGAPAAALVGRIGDKGEPFLIGATKIFTADRNGVLQFSPNVWDPLPDDNIGNLAVTITALDEPQLSPQPVNPPALPDIPDTSGPRIALIIGNSNYLDQPLANPVNDASLMEASLKAVGFTVIMALDADQKTLKILLRDFSEALESAGPDAVGLFYFAGHGIQVNGRNYLVPVDASIKTESDVHIESVAADDVLYIMRYAQNRLNFVILDACRNNPYKRSFRSATAGLARMEAASGTMIAYATSPGSVALDGDGQNSPYTKALATAITSAAVPVEKLFRQVRNEVMQYTKDRQIPWESSSLTGDDFYFTR